MIRTLEEAVHANDVVRVTIIATDPRSRFAVTAALRHNSHIELSNRPEVVVAVADTPVAAVDLAGRRDLLGLRLVVIARNVSPRGLIAAGNAGASAVIPRDDAIPGVLAAAIRTAAAGNGSVLQTDGSRRLSDREIRILRLIADGHSNAAIASLLSCSEHTVKNVIHDLMIRLQLRNRAHAAAYAVRAGLI